MQIYPNAAISRWTASERLCIRLQKVFFFGIDLFAHNGRALTKYSDLLYKEKKIGVVEEIPVS